MNNRVWISIEKGENPRHRLNSLFPAIVSRIKYWIGFEMCFDLEGFDFIEDLDFKVILIHAKVFEFLNHEITFLMSLNTCACLLQTLSSVTAFQIR